MATNLTAGPQYFRGDHRRASGDLSKKITVERARRNPAAQEAINTWSTAALDLRARSRAWRARSAPRESSAGKPSARRGRPWKDLTDSVNAMCGNLTDQLRKYRAGDHGVARGDLSRKITVDCSR